MDTPVVTVAVVVVLLTDVVGALFVGRKRRSPDLRERFGLRYDRIVSTPRPRGRAGPSSRSRRVARDGVSTEDLHVSVKQPVVRQPAAGNPSAGRSRSRPTGCPPSTATPWSYGSGGWGALLGWRVRLERPAAVEDLSGGPDQLTSTCGCLMHRQPPDA